MGWRAKGHKPEFIEKQARKGRKGLGVARVASLFDSLSNESSRPWDAEGVSRAWWYRKRQRARAACVD